MNWFKKETPKEAANKAKREARREVRVSVGSRQGEHLRYGRSIDRSHLQSSHGSD